MKNVNQYFDKNPVYDILKQRNASLIRNCFNLRIDPAIIISCYKQCPITSINFERGF